MRIITNNVAESSRQRGRFNWVRRLMQSPNRQNGELIDRARYNGDYYKPSKKKSLKIQEPHQQRSDDPEEFDDSSIETDTRESYNSDQMTSNSDNISTIPLKSIVSVPSTKSPSVLSNDINQDNHSYNPSTAETSIAPSSTTPQFNPILFNRDREGVHIPGLDRDSESIVTLASSTRRRRRRSLETNSSTVGIPPASIMERISAQPNSAYANSLNPNDITSVNEDNSSYKDYESQSSIAKST